MLSTPLPTPDVGKPPRPVECSVMPIKPNPGICLFFRQSQKTLVPHPLRAYPHNFSTPLPTRRVGKPYKDDQPPLGIGSPKTHPKPA